MTIKIGLMDMQWVEEFKDKLDEAGQLLSSVFHLAATTLKILDFLAEMKTNPKVQVDTKVNFGLIAHFKTGEGEGENHILEIKAAATAPAMIQALTVIAGEHCENLKHVEQDTPELQEILGAVSEFKDRVMEVGVDHCGNPFCKSCNGDGEEGKEPPLN